MEKQINPLIDTLGDLFVNREYELNLFWDWAINIPHRPQSSYALVGRRRTGKTSILKKLYHKLFYEQSEVLPVYISYDRYLNQKEPLTSYQFAETYFAGYVGSYLAFRYRKPLLMRSLLLEFLHEFALEVQDEYALDLFRKYERLVPGFIPHGLVQWVIRFSMNEAQIRDMPTVIIIDEFQVLTNVYDPKQNIHQDYTDSFQLASEAWWSPLLVSGSAVSLLTGQALGGMLSGRLTSVYPQYLTKHRLYARYFLKLL